LADAPKLDPDPADPKKEFAWMVLRFTPDRPVSYPLTDRKALSR
jgi:hypothetical protein